MCDVRLIRWPCVSCPKIYYYYIPSVMIESHVLGGMKRVQFVVDTEKMFIQKPSKTEAAFFSLCRCSTLAIIPASWVCLQT